MNYLLYTSALLLAAALAAPAQTPGDPPPQSVEAFREQVAAILASAPGAPAAGIVMIEGGEVVWEGSVGMANADSGRPADADTHYRIGSITKMFVAMAVMQQVERGRLTLDARVSDLAPELPLRNPWEQTHPVKVVNLLEHTAGFDDMHYRNWLTRSEPALAEVVLDLEAELVSRWQPDQWHAYSNPGYAVAAYLVEKSSGMRFEDYVELELLGPLGMRQTVWGREGVEASLAQGYDRTGRSAPWQQLKLASAGALISTPRDMARFANFLLARGQTAPGVLSEASLARMERAESAASARAGLSFAYGMGNYTRQMNNVAFKGHDGTLPGYLSTILYSSEHDVALSVMVASGDHGVFSRVRRLAANYLLRDAVLPQAGAFDRGAVANPANSGYYHPVNPANSLWGGLSRTLNGARLSAHGDHYRLSPPMTPWVANEYLPMPQGQLRDPGNALATGVFVEDASGRRAFTDIDAAYVRGTWWTVALPQYGVVAAVLLMLSTLAFALVWVPRRIFGGLRGATHLSTRVWPLLATLSFIAAIATAIQFRLEDMLEPNAKTLLFAALGWLFGLLALTAVVQGLRTFRAQNSKAVAIHSLLSSVAVFGLACWLWSIGLLGIRLWAW